MRVLGVLALTHSSRSFDRERGSVQFLTRRFNHPDRLAQVPAFSSLQEAPRSTGGAVSFLGVAIDRSGRWRFERLGHIQHRERIRHVIFTGDRELWVGYRHAVEKWATERSVHELRRLARRSFRVERRYEHPHLAGLHTVEAIPRDSLALSSSAADAVLLLDPRSGNVDRELRLPKDHYGQNYPLTSAMDLRRHYITGDWRAAHLNAAHVSPDRRWLAVSTLIQGAVGVFDLESGRYRELTRGFVGCRGARFDSEGRMYFADCTTGNLVFLEGGRIARRFAVGSPWLHDVLQIRGSVYAFALSEPNELRIYDLDRQQLLYRRRFWRCSSTLLASWLRRLPWWLGNSARTLSFLPWPASRENSGEFSA